MSSSGKKMEVAKLGAAHKVSLYGHPTRGTLKKPALSLPRRLSPMDSSADSECSSIPHCDTESVMSNSSPLILSFPMNSAVVSTLHRKAPPPSGPSWGGEGGYSQAAATVVAAAAQERRAVQISLLLQEEHAKRRRQWVLTDTQSHPGDCPLVAQGQSLPLPTSQLCSEGCTSEKADVAVEEEEVVLTDVPSTGRDHQGAPFPTSMAADAGADEETLLSANVLTDELLREWTGWEDLHLVLTTELRLDTESLLGVDRLAASLPRLVSLRLSKSRVPQVRQLGVRYMALRHLWLNNSHVRDLRGIGACAPHLRELYIAFNYVRDLSPLMDLAETLEVLDAEANQLEDAAMLESVLLAFRKMTSLVLQGNPAVMQEDISERLAGLLLTASPQALPTSHTMSAGQGDAHDGAGGGGARSTHRGEDARMGTYRRWVRAMLPTLTYLDDVPLSVSGGDEPFTDIGSEDSCDDAGQHRGATIATSTDAPLEGPPLLLPPRTSGSADEKCARPRSAYVDPMESALADELRLVQDCIRDCNFDTLDQMMDSMHAAIYTRPSTSCHGARPRVGSALRPMTGGRLGPGACDGNPRCGMLPPKSSRATPPSASRESSFLTTGGAFAGSAIVSLRKRLLPQPQCPLHQQFSPNSSPSPMLSDTLELRSPIPVIGVAATLGEGGDGSVSLAPCMLSPARAKSLLDSDDDASTVLFTDDEDEWGQFKATLLSNRQGLFLAGVAGGMPSQGESAGCRPLADGVLSAACESAAAAASQTMELSWRFTTGGLSQCPSREQPRSTQVGQRGGGVAAVKTLPASSSLRRLSASSGGATPSIGSMAPRPSTSQLSGRHCENWGGESRSREDSDFDALVRREVGRTRARIARAGQRSGVGDDVDDTFSNANFLENQERFAVMELTDLSAEVL